MKKKESSASKKHVKDVEDDEMMANMINLNQNYQSEHVRKYTRSPTFESLIPKEIVINSKIEDKKFSQKAFNPSTVSPKSKQEIMRLFSVPKSVKRKRLLPLFIVWISF